MNDERDGAAGGELPRNQEQSGASSGGRQLGGGPSASDDRAGGGSSGSGGYGKAQNQQFHQGQDAGAAGARNEPGQDRGERFDEAQGGGRDGGSVSDSDDLASDQAAHQDRGQTVAEAESDRD